MDTSKDIARALNRMRTSRGLAELSEEKIKQAIGHGAEGLFEKRLAEAKASPEDLLDEFRTIYRPMCTDNLNPFPGMENLLRTLATDRKAVVTNKPEDLAEIMLKAAGWWDWFEPVYGKNTLPERKPHPLPLLEVARSWEVPPERLIMIGDSWSDVRAGKRAGATTIGCDFGMGPAGSPGDLQPDYLVESVNELETCLEELRGSARRA